MNKEKQPMSQGPLSDETIIELYWARDEKAITETDRKYKKYLLTIAYNILRDDLDSEECLNDTYLGTWNTIPPQRPSVFQAFISKIMRNTAIVRYKKNRADKRIPSEMSVSLCEIANALPPVPSAEEDYIASQISRVISDYLRSLSERQAFIFICRYYCCDRISDIAQLLHVGESTVFRELTKIRSGLKERLVEGGYYNV